MSDTWLFDITHDLSPDETIFRDSFEEWLREHFCPLREGEHTELPVIEGGRKIAGMYLITECQEAGCGWRHREVLAREQIEDTPLRGMHLTLARTKSNEALWDHCLVEHDGSKCDQCDEPEPPHIGCLLAARLNSDYYTSGV